MPNSSPKWSAAAIKTRTMSPSLMPLKVWLSERMNSSEPMFRSVTTLSNVNFSGTEQLMLGQKVETEIMKKDDQQKTIVTFWASYDAESVKNCQRVIKESKDEKIILVSLDDYQSIYEDALTKIDANNVATKSLRVDKDSKVLADFKFNGEFKSFLIDENGYLLEIN